MTGAKYAIKIEGLREFQRALKSTDRDLPKALRIALNEASQFVAEDARSRVPVLTGRAKASIKTKSTQTQARISGGSGRVPYYGWLDFGGRVGRSFGVHRPRLADGRYLYPAYFKARDSGQIQESLSKAITSVARRAGLEVT